VKLVVVVMMQMLASRWLRLPVVKYSACDKVSYGDVKHHRSPAVTCFVFVPDLPALLAGKVGQGRNVPGDPGLAPITQALFRCIVLGKSRAVADHAWGRDNENGTSRVAPSFKVIL